MSQRDPYRTAAEHAAADEEGEYIDEVLDKARANLASMLVVIQERADPEVVELWVNRSYDDLRAALTRQQLLRALLCLLMPDARRIARNLRRGVSDVDLP